MTERSAIAAMMDQIGGARDTKQKVDAVRRGKRGHGRIPDALSIAGKLRKLRVGDTLYLADRTTANSANLWRDVVGKFRSTRTSNGITVVRVE